MDNETLIGVKQIKSQNNRGIVLWAISFLLNAAALALHISNKEEIATYRQSVQDIMATVKAIEIILIIGSLFAMTKHIAFTRDIKKHMALFGITQKMLKNAKKTR